MRRDAAALRQFRTLWTVGTLGDLTDGQLLERFATSRDEAAAQAFAALVERHGPLVLRVCRSVLRDEQDAEDAFQATFLVLVRKAGSLWVRDSLGPWLHQVAYRAAWCARRTIARRRAHERRASRMAIAQVSCSSEDQSLAWALHQEVERLPERYRSPVILCDLEGQSYEQAARHLECPVGTIKSRLARGRELLRSRLTRRGLSLAVLATPAPPQIPPALLDSTIKIALAASARTAAASASVAGLARIIQRSLLMNQLKLVVVTVATASLLAGGAALRAHQADDANGPPIAQAATAQPKEAQKTDERVVPNEPRGRPVDILNEVEAPTTIIMVLPEGTHVKKGDVICELDSSALRDQLINQVIAVKAAEAAHLNAKSTRETTEVAVIEFTEGTARLERQATEGAIEVAQAELALAENELAVAKNDPSGQSLARKRAEVEKLRARNSLRDSQTRLDVLTKYTIPRKAKELKSELEKARAAELAKQAAWELERSKEDKLRRLITKCTIRATADGELVYLDRPTPPKAPKLRPVEEGATVRERQGLFLIYPDKPEQPRK